VVLFKPGLMAGLFFLPSVGRMPFGQHFRSTHNKTPEPSDPEARLTFQSVNLLPAHAREKYWRGGFCVRQEKR